ncbi:aspartyl/asparaginyl beta-hydroxylase domain-containing protein [Mesorhizobium sp. CO1-1-8]|uniref:aspartyl/asparaginyl beta-hydroxylase domain-containing protein n=1 Tax=Mesorhizobium sp. CO1-1-8 TaxID=2876631 RepID=UPI001CD09C53|nr:aspartyl/asparaginyl beta-hydroxylase domain-containing protein [Mesorhizobium sp. CO1-1-8]MBZ9770987.1 aspartyl/asparaginyl beta-hydroxylase domain-containing protein [Mesorhizobium sp. CO1-1-8]
MVAAVAQDTDAFALPFKFDRNRLAKDVEQLQNLVRLPQPGPYHKGEWAGVAIHAAGGVQTPDSGFPSIASYAFTPEACHAPYLKEILGSLPFVLQVVRVLWLPAGGKIGNHFDFDTNFQFGLVRLHIPMQTNPDVEFLIAGRRIDMNVGEFWYGDFSKPHEVINRGKQDRLHAVLDVEVNDALLGIMPADYIDTLSRLGPISKHRAPYRKSDDLATFECSFRIPGTIVPLLKKGKLVDMIKGATAVLRRDGNDLHLYFNGTPHCTLMRVTEKEFAVVGMPPGCFFRIERSGVAPIRVTLIVRGVQEDLVAARVGVVRGERIPEREIDFGPLLAA